MKTSVRFLQIVRSVIWNEYFQVALLLCILVCLFFGRNLLSGESIFLEIKKDPSSFYAYYPWERFSREVFHSGYIPLWNPHSGLGFPLQSNFHSAIFYPPKILIHLLPFIAGLDTFLMARLLIAGFFTFLFCRSIQIGRIGSVVAAISFMFCGHFMRYLNMVMLNVEICIPVLLWAINSVVERRKVSSLVLVSGVLCLPIIGGHPETILYALLFAGGWVIFKLFYNSKTSITERLKGYCYLLGGALILGFLLSAFQVIPFLQYLGRSWNYHSVDLGRYYLNIEYIITLLLPWFYGDSSSLLINSYYLIPYFGIVPFSLALFALIKIKSSNRYGIFFMGSSIFFMGLAYGFPGFNLIHFLPIFNQLSMFARSPVLPASFSIAIVAGIGLDYLMKKQCSARAFYWSLAMIFLFVGSVSLFNLVKVFQQIKQSYMGFQIGLAAVWLALLFAFFRWYSQKRIKSFLFGILMILLTYFTLLVDNLGNKALYQNETKEQLNASFIDYLKTDAEVFRFHFFPFMLFPSNLGTLYSLSDIRIADPLIERRNMYLLNFLKEIPEEELESNFCKLSFIVDLGLRNIDSPILDLVNLKYIVSRYGLRSHKILDEILGKAKILTINKRYFGFHKLPEILGIKDILYQHPPTLINFPLRIPEGGAFLDFVLEMSPRSWLPDKGDGAGFALDLIAGTKEERIFFRYIDPKRNELDRKRRWVKINLDSYRGKEVILRLITDPGPKGDNNYDWADWGELHLEVPDQSGKYELVSDQGVGIYKNRDVFPRAFIVHEKEIIKNDEEILKRMESKNFDLRKVVILEEDPPKLAYVDNLTTDNSETKIVDYQATKVEIETQMDREGFLVLSDSCYPGWKVYVDGNQQKIYRADYLLRAVHLSSGFHRLKFVFDPLSFKLGLWMALSTIFCLGVFIGFSKLTKSNDIGNYSRI
ncbi:MAG: YfhO family protein [Deltaproteobacteria bacterium]|nr:MAG: YfhO family protein [Deltaproteobacteria bacterium]